MTDKKKEALKNLTPLQYEVTQKNGTEKPFANKYWDHKEEGIYVDIVSGEALFSSKTKYDSGSGWPSFYKPINQESITEHEDTSLERVRTEIKSKKGKSHLGHVFNDGPQEKTGLRYCVNSASLRFIPLKDLEKEGYGEFKKLFEKKEEKDYIILAGGCFWGMEELFSKLPGVQDVVVGYTGGDVLDPTYKLISTGSTNHAEAIKITYDATETSLEKIYHFFFKIHDPTTLNRQGNDVGTQYRSAIFARNKTQEEIAVRVIDEVNKLKRFKKPIVTKIEKEKTFYLAEEYHQDYLQKNPSGYTCHYIRD